MSPGPDPLTPEPGRDRVADFFSAERARVRDLPPAPDHFDVIVGAAAGPAGRRWLPYIAVAAAAAVIAGAVGAGLLHGDEVPADRVDTASSTLATSAPTVTVTSTRTVGPPATATQPSASAASPSPPPTGQTAPVVLPVPRTFDVVSMTNAGGGHLYALGAASCPAGPCASVVASDDDGHTWTARSSFPELTTAAARSTPDRPNELVGVRFASPQVGYVFGSVVRRTTDGGRTWHAVDVGGRVVLSLETDGRQVWMATARGCRHTADDRRGCQGLQPLTASVSHNSASTVQVPSMPSDAESAWVAMDGPAAYYNVATTVDRRPAVAARLSGTPARLPVPNGCAAGQGMWVSAPATTRGTLMALCASAAKPDQQYAVALSTDAGATWTARPAPALGAPGGSGVWLTANDPRHLVAVRQGLPTSAAGSADPTSTLVSDDGGATWRTQRLPAASWAGAAGAGIVYVLSGGTSYWVSTDAGTTFTQAPLRP